MKFPRNAKIISSHFDVAPFAAVFFVLMIFLLLDALLPVPGISLQPPTADDLPGTDRPTITMAVDSQERLFFENELVTEAVLKTRLAAEVKKSAEPLTLVIHADNSVSYKLLAHLALLARGPLNSRTNPIGITNILLATLPGVPEARLKP